MKKSQILVLVILVAMTALPTLLFNFNKHEVPMSNGISIGNALEAPIGKDWGVDIENKLFDEIKSQGFDTVRIPVRFSDYIDETYILDETFMLEVDGYINYALSLDLVVVLDLHHFVELMDQNIRQDDEYKSLPADFDYMRAYYEIWEQLSERYQDYPKELIFELLNEPKDDITSDIWNEMVDKSIELIRKTNPTRKIVVSAPDIALLWSLGDLALPKDDNLIVTFHYYSPTEFAFQNDENHDYQDVEEIIWEPSDENIERLEYEFAKVRDFAMQNDVEVMLGEFGVAKTAPRQSRIDWIDAVTDVAKEYGFSCIYWELGHNFGVYNLKTGEWDTQIVQALLD